MSGSVTKKETGSSFRQIILSGAGVQLSAQVDTRSNTANYLRNQQMPSTVCGAEARRLRGRQKWNHILDQLDYLGQDDLIKDLREMQKSDKNQTTKMEVQGRRDFGKDAPQSTYLGYRMCILFGLESVEFDMRKTKDGRLVITNGPDTKGHDEEKLVEEKNWEEVLAEKLQGSDDHLELQLALRQQANIPKQQQLPEVYSALAKWVESVLPEDSNHLTQNHKEVLESIQRKVYRFLDLDTKDHIVPLFEDEYVKFVCDECVKFGLKMNINIKDSSQKLNKQVTDRLELIGRHNPDLKLAVISSSNYDYFDISQL